MRLAELFKSGYAYDMDLNCAERLISGANLAYGLGLDGDARKLAGLFGGGMYSGNVCGAVTGSLMALGKLIIEDRAHATENAAQVTRKFISDYNARAGAIDCALLRPRYYTPETKCYRTQDIAAEVLDDLVISLGLMDGDGNMIK